MQEKELTGDALLALDADYVRGTALQVYYAYPSAKLPRFLVPVHDAVGLHFVLRLLASEWGRAGFVVRALLHVPGAATVMRILLFKRTIVTP